MGRIRWSVVNSYEYDHDHLEGTLEGVMMSLWKGIPWSWWLSKKLTDAYCDNDMILIMTQDNNNEVFNNRYKKKFVSEMRRCNAKVTGIEEIM